MKTLKKLLTIGLSVLLMFCMGISLVGCNKTGPIPNGNYAFIGAVYTFEYTGGEIKDIYGWIIEGDEAEQWVSGVCTYKAKIVEEDGVLRFDGYKWRNLLDVLFGNVEKQGSNHDYIVVYNETDKSITLTPVDISSER